LNLGFLLRRIFKKESDQFPGLETGLDYFFRDPALLKEALTHRSYCQERDSSYERLEFLGDSVIGLVISRLLY